MIVDFLNRLAGNRVIQVNKRKREENRTKKETSNLGTGTVTKKSLKQQIYYYRSFYIMFILVFICKSYFIICQCWESAPFPFSYKGIKAPTYRTGKF